MEPVQTRHYPSRAPSARFRGVPVHRLALRRHCARYSHISRRTPPPSYRLPCFPNSVNPQLLLRSNDASPAPILPRPGSYQPIDRAWLVVLSTTTQYPEGDNVSNRRRRTRQKKKKGVWFPHFISDWRISRQSLLGFPCVMEHPEMQGARLDGMLLPRGGAKK